jgi:hypothetical protein
MDIRIIIGVPLALAVLFYGIFKINAKEKLLIKVLFIEIAFVCEFTLLGKYFNINSIVYPIIMYGGIIAFFVILGLIYWKERKNSKMKAPVMFYFGALGFIVLYVIAMFILNQMGIVHFGK